LIGNAVHGSVHLDESGYIKSGGGSVGVKRQYCGRIGKVDNCQMGVFLGYALWNYRTLIDRRLYLPKDWVDDPHRRARCSVPEAITFKTKAELGWGMLLNARKSFQINPGSTFSCGIPKGKSYGAIWCVYVSIRFEMSFLAENRGSLSEKTITGQ
jgi:hypothetical protein